MLTGGGGIPTDVSDDVARVLGVRDAGRAEVEPLSGGCIHPAARVRHGRGSFFLKWAEEPGTTGFGVEARGLEALRETDGPYVPEVLGFGQGSGETRGWIALEFIEPGQATEVTAKKLGTRLAGLHRPMAEAIPGWHEDGFIGTLPQSNRSREKPWSWFWRENRLEPLWQSVKSFFAPAVQVSWHRAMEALPTALAGAAPLGLSLLHGDLWSGNVLTSRAGEPVLIDPAVYIGDREVDLAMMELFGGFASSTLESYRLELTTDPGFEAVRRDVYQLYPLLVHVRLFGRGYAKGVATRLSRIRCAV